MFCKVRKVEILFEKRRDGQQWHKIRKSSYLTKFTNDQFVFQTISLPIFCNYDKKLEKDRGFVVKNTKTSFSFAKSYYFLLLFLTSSLCLFMWEPISIPFYSIFIYHLQSESESIHSPRSLLLFLFLFLQSPPFQRDNGNSSSDLRDFIRKEEGLINLKMAVE